MGKTPKYAREKMIELMKDTRAQQRCDLVRELLSELKENNKDVYDERDGVTKELSDVREQLSKLRKKERELERKESEIGNKITKVKREAQLYITSPSESGTCRAGHLHPKLEEFDIETKRIEIQILTDEEVDKSIVGL